MQLNIRLALPRELHHAREIAAITWPVAYSHILAPGQLEYMLGIFYSDEALADQHNNQQHEFFLASDEKERYIGFASYSYIGNEQAQHIYKLHKLYVLPDRQKTGAGKQLLKSVLQAVKARGATQLILNVNRHNTAIQFYQKLGFEILREEDIDIGEGYWMNDYVMSKEVQNVLSV